MKNLHIKDSYDVWSTNRMHNIIRNECKKQFGYPFPDIILNRKYITMYVEWYLHNVGYYATLPFTFIKYIKELNLRFKSVDLQEYKHWR